MGDHVGRSRELGIGFVGISCCKVAPGGDGSMKRFVRSGKWKALTRSWSTGTAIGPYLCDPVGAHPGKWKCIVGVIFSIDRTLCHPIVL